LDEEHEAGTARDHDGRRVSRGWWRRNRWGVLLLVPALGLAVAQPVQDQWDRFWHFSPRTPVTAKAGTWTTFGGVGFRLESFESVASYKNDFGTPVTLPSGQTLWRASLAFRSSHPDPLSLCQVQAIDAAGNAYDFGPSELADAGIFLADGDMCMPSFDGPASANWTDIEYFVLPAGDNPTAVRILVPSDYPKYLLIRRS
jgi:hypothetical protein